MVVRRAACGASKTGVAPDEHVVEQEGRRQGCMAALQGGVDRFNVEALKVYVAQ